MYARKYRLFHADVELNAPKDRTLFNYNIKDGWPKLCKFLGEISIKMIVDQKSRSWVKWTPSDHDPLTD